MALQSAPCCCQAGAVKTTLQPPPPAPDPFQTDSPCQVPPASSVASRVPPTDTTCGDEAGYWVMLRSETRGEAQLRKPSSPAEAVMTTPGSLNGRCWSLAASIACSAVPHEFEITVAPSVSARRSAPIRFSLAGSA